MGCSIEDMCGVPPKNLPHDVNEFSDAIMPIHEI
jgi:hypothetical protein